jgi:RND family efflux transporter MFP subunit
MRQLTTDVPPGPLTSTPPGRHRSPGHTLSGEVGSDHVESRRAWPLTPFIVLVAAGCSGRGSSDPEVARPVKTMVVAAGEKVHVRSIPGKVEASKRAELAFQVSGLLEKLPVNEGQKVVKGAVIAKLRQKEFQARLTALQGTLDQARATLRALRSGERPEERLRLEAELRAAEAKLGNARTEYDRAQRLITSNAISSADFDKARTAYQVAQERHKAARQVLETGLVAREEDIEAKEGAVRGLEGQVVEAKLQLDDATLRAPYDGVIAKRFVQQGQKVTAKEPIVRFQDVDELEVVVDVPETVMASDLSAADIVELVAELSGAPGRRIPVHIREVAQAADPVTQTFRVRVAMQAPPGVRVLPGMTATVTLTYRRASILGDRILVPISAIFKDSTGAQVAWVLGADHTVTRRAVTLGTATGGSVEILNGLQPGERIAVAGVSFLREGMQVRDLGDALGGSQQ